MSGAEMAGLERTRFVSHPRVSRRDDDADVGHRHTYPLLHGRLNAPADEGRNPQADGVWGADGRAKPPQRLLL